jgi:SAM-dependent methyltransferase
MPLSLCRVIHLEDFRKPVVRDVIRDVFAHEVSQFAQFPDGRENRKQWEIAMAVLALRAGGALRPDAEVLGIGAGTEATLFWLTNHVGRVWATDLYGDPGAWTATAVPRMLTDPGHAWPGRWNPRRLVVQHMDACNLAYEDETFDAIFSSGSIEHFGSLECIQTAMDEAFRTLKPGGTVSFSTEFLINAAPPCSRTRRVMFADNSSSAWYWGVEIGRSRLRSISRSNATTTTEMNRRLYDAIGPTYAHCVLRTGPNLLRASTIPLREAVRPARFRIVSPVLLRALSDWDR